MSKAPKMSASPPKKKQGVKPAPKSGASAGPSADIAPGIANDPAPKKGPAPIAVDPRLLEILICPKSRTTLSYDRVNNELISAKAGLAYPIRNGVPIMLVDEARKIPK